MRDRRSVGAALVAAGCLAGGYADLAIGGLTVGPVLLVVGYCVAIPVAVLIRGRSGRG